MENGNRELGMRTGKWKWGMGTKNRNENIILVGKIFLLSQNNILNTLRAIFI